MKFARRGPLSTCALIGGLLGASMSCAQAQHNPPGFEDVSIVVVYSATDEDAQVIVQGGSDDSLLAVLARGPRGVRLTWGISDRRHLGYADFQFDSPEPSLAALAAAYPAGTYTFLGLTAEGALIRGNTELSYDLLDPPVPLFPLEGDDGIPVNGLVAMWEAIPGADAIRFEIEDEEEEVALKADLPGDATTFSLPDGWLEPGIEYVMDIKAIAENGNQTVSDLRFTTAQ